jgi:hypothetical protein
MSEPEQPTAVSDEQPETPVRAASADSPETEPAKEPLAEESAAEDSPDEESPDEESLGQSTDEGAPSTEDGGASERQSSPSAEGEPAADGVDDADERADLLGSISTAGSSAPAAGGRSPLLRPRNLALVGVVFAIVVLAAVMAPIAWEAWSSDDGEISTPAQVAGLVLDDSPGAHETIDYLRIAVQTGVSLEKSTGAVYADAAGQSRSVLFVGGTGSIGSPEDALAKTFRLISDDTGGVENVRSVPAGPRGGAMQCGSTKTDGDSMAVCGWADSRSLGIAMFPNRPVDQASELLRSMRNVMQDGH